MASWILPKSERNSLSWAPSALRIVSFVRFLEESKTPYCFFPDLLTFRDYMFKTYCFQTPVVSKSSYSYTKSILINAKQIGIPSVYVKRLIMHCPNGFFPFFSQFNFSKIGSDQKPHHGLSVVHYYLIPTTFAGSNSTTENKHYFLRGLNIFFASFSQPSSVRELWAKSLPLATFRRSLAYFLHHLP